MSISARACSETAWIADSRAASIVSDVTWSWSCNAAWRPCRRDSDDVMQVFPPTPSDLWVVMAESAHRLGGPKIQSKSMW